MKIRIKCISVLCILYNFNLIWGSLVYFSPLLLSYIAGKVHSVWLVLPRENRHKKRNDDTILMLSCVWENQQKYVTKSTKPQR